MPPLLPSPPPLPYFVTRSRNCGSSSNSSSPGSSRSSNYGHRPAASSPKRPSSPGLGIRHPLEASASQEPRHAPPLDHRTAADDRHVVPSAKLDQPRPPPLHRGASHSAPPSGDGRLLCSPELPQSFHRHESSHQSSFPPPLDPESHLNFYRTQILDNCRLLFPLESNVHIITSPRSAYITNTASPPRILLDSTGGLRELYHKSQEQVAIAISSLRRHQDQGGSAASMSNASSKYQLPTKKPEVGSKAWGRDAISAMSGYMAIRKEEQRRQRDWEKTAARKIPAHMRYASAPPNMKAAPMMRKPWSSMDLAAAAAGRDFDSGPREDVVGVNMEQRFPIGMQSEAAGSDLERKIEMDSGPQTRNQVFDKVQKWRVEVPVAEACSPMSPPPVDNIAGLDSTLPRTVERPGPLRVNYVAGPPPKRGFIDTSVIISDHEDDDYELIDHGDAADDNIGYFGTVVKGS